MFVFKDGDTYIHRNLVSTHGYGPSIYTSMSDLGNATVFTSWKEVVDWINQRKDFGFPMLPDHWEIVEVRKVEQPKYEVVKVIG